MKKIVFSLFVFIQCFICSSVCAADTVDLNNLKTTRVGVYDNYPKIYRDGSGGIKGFWADITNYIAQKEGWNIEYVYGTWEDGLARLERGDIDIMVDVGLSEDRRQKYDFNNETALISWGTIYTRKGLSINSVQELQNKKIAILTSSVHYTSPVGLRSMLDSFGVTADIINVPNYDDVFKMLDTNQADAGAVGWYYGVANEDKYNVRRTNLIFDPSELRYAFPKNSPNNSYFVNVIDADLKILKQDPKSPYFSAINTNFGKYLKEVEVLPKWWTTFWVVLGALAFVFLIGLFFMRRYERKLKQELEKKIAQFRESEEKYAAVLDQAQDGILIIQDKICKFTNKAIEIIGYKNEEVVGHVFIDFIALDERKKVMEMYERRAAGIRVKSVYETKLQHKNGSMVDVELSSGMIQYGHAPADLVIIRDISERKKFESRLKNLDVLKTKFIEIVAHQLRTPLNVSRWNLESLLSGSHGDMANDLKAFLRISLDANVEVINRIGALLTALDIEENRLVYLRKKPTSIENLLESVVTNIKPRCSAKNVVCVYEAPKAPLSIVNVDADRIRICIENILNNAMTYTKEGGTISISLEEKDEKIRCEVRDTGVGIPKIEQENVGMRFFRASNATDIRTDASGLGIFITKYFIEQHGGTFGFISEQGKGSTFWFEIPTAKGLAK